MKVSKKLGAKQVVMESLLDRRVSTCLLCLLCLRGGGSKDHVGNRHLSDIEPHDGDLTIGSERLLSYQTKRQNEQPAMSRIYAIYIYICAMAMTFMLGCCCLILYSHPRYPR